MGVALVVQAVPVATAGRSVLPRRGMKRPFLGGLAMAGWTLEKLSAFVVRAKAATYAGGGPRSLSYRPGSHDLQYHEAPFAYLDSHFGGADFIGQEVVFFEGRPVWAMNYYGRLLEPALI